MDSDVVNEILILARVDKDPRLTSQRQRCEIFAGLIRRSNLFGPEDYTTAGRQGCAEFPLDEVAGDRGGR